MIVTAILLALALAPAEAQEQTSKDYAACVDKVEIDYATFMKHMEEKYAHDRRPSKDMMRVGEQIDALELLGVSPTHRLVGPRVLVCMIALPVLTFERATERVSAISSAWSGLGEMNNSA